MFMFSIWILIMFVAGLDAYVLKVLVLMFMFSIWYASIQL